MIEVYLASLSTGIPSVRLLCRLVFAVTRRLLCSPANYWRHLEAVKTSSATVDASHRCVTFNRSTDASGEIRPLVVRRLRRSHVVFILCRSNRRRSSVKFALGRLVLALVLSPVAWHTPTISALANKYTRSSFVQ
jgi:hypothetical protein